MPPTPKLGHDFKLQGKNVVHQPTGTRMVLVPGGTFTMGFTIDDIRSVWQVVTEPNEIARQFERSRPAHAVSVAPFLLASSLAVGEDEGVSAKHALAAVASAGLRLPSEAEWEWVAREGGRVRFTAVPAKSHPLRAGKAEGKWSHGPNGLGVGDLLDGEFVADALHDSYAGAPSDGSAWGQNAAVTRFGHIWWQSDAEAVGLHAAARNSSNGEDSRYRFAASLPGAKAPKTKPIDPTATMKETLAGFLENDPLPSIRTLETLLAITIHDDTRALIAALPRVLAKMKTGQDDVVRVLADAASRSQALAKLLAGAKLPTKEAEAAGIVTLGGVAQSAMAGRTPDRRNCSETIRGPDKGKPRWKVRVGKRITAPVIGADRTIYVGVADGRLCALSPNGKKLWSFRGQGAVLRTPAIAPDGRIWFGTDKGKLYGIPASGDAKGKLEFALKLPLNSPAIAPDGTVYVAAVRGPLTAIRDGKIAWRYETKPNGSTGLDPAVGSDGEVYFSSDAQLHAIGPDGKLRWKFKDSPYALIVGRGGIVYIVGDTYVRAIEPTSGKLRWEIARRHIDEDFWGSCGGLAQDAAGTLFVSSMSSDACAYVLAEKDGKPKRKLQANNWVHAPVTIDADGRAFFGSLMNVYAFGGNGKRLWHAPLDGRLTGPLALANDGTLFGGTDKGALHAWS